MTEISSNNKRIAKNTLYLYLRMLFAMGVGLYSSRVVLTVLGVEDFGIYNVVGGLVAMFSLLNGSLSGAIQRFLTFELGAGNKERLKAVFTSSINILFIVSFLIFILAETVGLWFLNVKMNIPENRMLAANWVYQLSLLTFILGIVSVPYNAAIIAHEDFKIYARISIFEVLLKLGVVLCLKITMPVDELILYSILLFGVTAIIRICYGFYCTKHYEECKYSKKIDIPLFKEMFAFSSWTFIFEFSYILKNQGIAILLNFFYGAIVNAALGIANQLSATVSAFVDSFIVAVNPQITKQYAAKNYENVNHLVCYSARFSFLFLLIFIVPVYVETEYILGIWLKQTPQYAVTFIHWILINVLISSLTNGLSTLINATGKIAIFRSIIGGIMLLIIPVSLLFLKLGYAPQVTMLILCVFNVIGLVLYLIFAKILSPFSIRLYFYNVTLRITTISLSIFALLFVLKFFLLTSILPIINIIVAFSITLFFVIFGGIKKSERMIIYTFVRRNLNYK